MGVRRVDDAQPRACRLLPTQANEGEATNAERGYSFRSETVNGARPESIAYRRKDGARQAPTALLRGGTRMKRMSLRDAKEPRVLRVRRPSRRHPARQIWIWC